jgi:hypothetical protein
MSLGRHNEALHDYSAAIKLSPEIAVLYVHRAKACAVNVVGDGRVAVAAYADGTLRWHRIDDGREILAFMPLADRRNWVAWTPDGFYAASPGAQSVLRWHVNRSGPAHLRLDFAEQDAHDLLSALSGTQDALYGLGSRQYLADKTFSPLAALFISVRGLYMAISTDFQYRHRRNAPEADPELDLLGPLRDSLAATST